MAVRASSEKTLFAVVQLHAIEAAALLAAGVDEKSVFSVKGSPITLGNCHHTEIMELQIFILLLEPSLMDSRRSLRPVWREPISPSMSWQVVSLHYRRWLKQNPVHNRDARPLHAPVCAIAWTGVQQRHLADRDRATFGEHANHGRKAAGGNRIGRCHGFDEPRFAAGGGSIATRLGLTSAVVLST